MRKTTGPVRRGVMGRWTIFGPKVNDKDHRVQGILTEDGLVAVERGRAELRAVYKSVMGRDPVKVSDADAIEFLARGELNTRAYLRAKRREEAAAK